MHAKGGQGGTLGADRVDVIGDVGGFGAQPMHGRRGNPQMQAAGWQNRLIERRAAGQNVNTARRLVQRRWTGLTLDHARQRVEIVERLILINNRDRPIGAQRLGMARQLAHGFQPGAAVGAAEIGDHQMVTGGLASDGR